MRLMIFSGKVIDAYSLLNMLLKNSETTERQKRGYLVSLR